MKMRAFRKDTTAGNSIIILSLLGIAITFTIIKIQIQINPKDK